jgi:nucleotide-binding universal stress UspA family protein
VDIFLYDVPKILLMLAVIVFAVAIIRSFFPPEKTRKYLSRTGLYMGNVLAASPGIVTPFCSCSAVPLFIGFEDEAVTAAITGYLREAAEAEAAAIRAEGIAVTADVVVASRVDEAITDRARELDADIIVMGTHGRTGLARAVIGSVADRSYATRTCRWFSSQLRERSSNMAAPVIRVLHVDG